MEELNNTRELILISAKLDIMDSFIVKPKEEEIKLSCQFCMSHIENDMDGVPLMHCGHIFHRECLH